MGSDIQPRPLVEHLADPYCPEDKAVGCEGCQGEDSCLQEISEAGLTWKLEGKYLEVEEVIKASDCKCCQCGKQAVCFWPMVDPDIRSHPYCRECKDEQVLTLYMAMSDMPDFKK